MADLVRLIQIKTAGPEGKHCHDKCPLKYADRCDDADYDPTERLLLRTPKCLHDARQADEPDMAATKRYLESQGVDIDAFEARLLAKLRAARTNNGDPNV